MSNIIKIVIKNSSGYGCIDTSYNEKLSIEPQKISYSLNQWGRDENDLVKKWSYENKTSEFQKLFNRLSIEMRTLMSRIVEEECLDIGVIEFIVVFSDKVKWRKEFYLPSHFFSDVFDIIKEMLPIDEEIPQILLTDNDSDSEYLYPIWDSEKDYLVGDSKMLLQEGETKESEQYFNWAYSLNTAVGLYRRSEIRSVQKEEIHKLSNGEEIVFSYTEELPMCLMLDNGKECRCIIEDIDIWATRYYNEFMVFSSNKTDKTYLIDSRGIIFQLPCTSNFCKYSNENEIEVDKRVGCYRINGVTIYYRSPEQREKFLEKSQANYGAVFNKEFNRFIRKNAKNDVEYLYLTAGNSKCGVMVSYFADRGMKYEVVPNIFCDDDTVNIRIPLTGENVFREDVQFLCAKYSNNYCIYNIPYTQVGGGLEFPQKWKKKYYEQGYYLPKGKEAMIYSIVNTLHIALGVDDDYEIFKKSLSKISKLFSKGQCKTAENSFTSILLMHPNDERINDTYIVRKRKYIDELLKDVSYNYKKTGNKTINEDDNSGQILNYFSNELYVLAYKESKKRFKERMQSYESGVLSEIGASGKRISRWVNESNLFTAVVKEYPDAIYQYRSTWLGLQSLDIYIPSICVGIEYQGEQHYHAVKLFGGEEGFRNTIIRDRKKAELCRGKGVKLIYWRYDEVISKSRIKKRIHDTLVEKEK